LSDSDAFFQLLSAVEQAFGGPAVFHPPQAIAAISLHVGRATVRLGECTDAQQSGRASQCHDQQYSVN
jgi:hypothetical protein